jgi:hypothetical protein
VLKNTENCLKKKRNQLELYYKYCLFSILQARHATVCLPVAPRADVHRSHSN